MPRCLPLVVLAIGSACAHDPVAAPASEAEAACRALVEAYALARDRVDAATVAALFARGAEVTFGDERVRGPSAIAAQMQRRAKGTRTRHLMSTAQFKQEGPEQVNGLSYFLVFEEPMPPQGPPRGDLPGAPPPPPPVPRPLPTQGVRAVVEYHDTCVRIDDAWKIMKRVVRPVFVRP